MKKVILFTALITTFYPVFATVKKASKINNTSVLAMGKTKPELQVSASVISAYVPTGSTFYGGEYSSIQSGKYYNSSLDAIRDQVGDLFGVKLETMTDRTPFKQTIYNYTVNAFYPLSYIKKEENKPLYRTNTYGIIDFSLLYPFKSWFGLKFGASYTKHQYRYGYEVSGEDKDGNKILGSNVVYSRSLDVLALSILPRLSTPYIFNVIKIFTDNGPIIGLTMNNKMHEMGYLTDYKSYYENINNIYITNKVTPYFALYDCIGAEIKLNNETKVGCSFGISGRLTSNYLTTYSATYTNFYISKSF